MAFALATPAYLFASSTGIDNNNFYLKEETTDRDTTIPLPPLAAIQLSSQVNSAAFDTLRRLIDDRYSYKDIREINWDNLFGSYEQSLLQAPTPPDFGKITAEMLSNAKDRHIWVRAGDQQLPVYHKKPIKNVNDKHIQDNFAFSQQLSKDVAIAALKTNPEIGYLFIGSWKNKEDVPLAIEGIDRLADKTAILIDLRANSGGSDTNASGVFSHLTDKKTVYEKWIVRDPVYPGGWSELREAVIAPSEGLPHYKGRIVVLSGQVCMSACEGSLLMLRAIGGAIIGDTSRGSTGAPKEYDLGNGVTVGLPSMKAYIPDGTLVEGNGIKPDTYVEFIEGYDYGSRDPVLDAAVEYIKRQQSLGTR